MINNKTYQNKNKDKKAIMAKGYLTIARTLGYDQILATTTQQHYTSSLINSMIYF